MVLSKKVIILAIVFLFSVCGCRSLKLFLMSRSVEYEYVNGALEIISIKPKIKDVRKESAFLLGYKMGFEALVNGKLGLVSWADDEIGEMAELGYACGFRDAKEYMKTKESNLQE